MALYQNEGPDLECLLHFEDRGTMNQELVITEKFPLMFRVPDTQHWCGYISVLGKEFSLSVEIPESESLSQATISCSDDMRILLQGKEFNLCEKLTQRSSVLDFLVDLSELLRACVLSDVSGQLGHPTPSPGSINFDRIELITKELRQITNCTLISSNPLFTHLLFRTLEPSSIPFEISVPIQYPLEIPQILGAFPVNVTPIPVFEKRCKQYPGVTDHVTLFDCTDAVVTMTEECSGFFEIIHEIDKTFMVIDPLHPTFSDKHRRIIIEPNLSSVIQFDPLSMTTPPKFTFFGTLELASMYENRLSQNLQFWDPQASITHNLELMFGVQLPKSTSQPQSSSTFDSVDLAGCCGICYEIHPDEEENSEEFADLYCPNKQCSKAFHPSCLRRWFQTQTVQQTSFNTLFGQCPYCHQNVGVPIR
ncbi:putative E3 ubiquitin-protein ligase FANCL [Blattamonas nauphoetae]|uniref:E3 ubiquitin-protein ligase FANCL n=1 Tax=Blattamonas nauphoetae TaxID=2049346 RepID=A0ABQ9XD15_9EUKA|nr:putative E3 ubiquitin-protein ligase FANCL [Blattamonas nauphoetae]